MSKRISREEQETVILFNESDEPARITTFNGIIQRKLAKAAEAYPDMFRRVRTDEYGGETWEVPRRRMSVNFRPPISDEQKAKRSEQAKARGLGYWEKEFDEGEGW